LLNAKDATEQAKQKHIGLRAFTEKNKVLVQVEDNGEGIPATKLDQIFIPFFTTKEQGSGIGLSLSRQIMYLHNGNIFVKSAPMKGSVFTLQF